MKSLLNFQEAVLHAHALNVRRWRDLVTVIVPRHPHRAAGVSALAAERGLPCTVVDATDGVIPGTGGGGGGGGGHVYVVRTIGHLPALYAQAQVAFVGGSLLPTGRGHNVVRPPSSSSPLQLLTGLRLVERLAGVDLLR